LANKLAAFPIDPNPVGTAFGGGSDRGPDPGGDGSFVAITNKTTGDVSEVICSNNTRANGGVGCSNHHALSLQYQGIIKHTRLATTSVGTQADVDMAVKFYEEKWWLEALAARQVSAIWMRHFDPHSYENTAFEAYVDLYILTGEQRYMDAMVGAWNMSMDHFIHVGGAMAYNQNNPKAPGAPGSYSPGSYHLNEYGWWPPTGETCGESVSHQGSQMTRVASSQGPSTDCISRLSCLAGSVMWAKFNQRMHRVFPEEEKYTTEIERSIYNIGIAAQGVFLNGSRGAGIRYFAVLHGVKAAAGAGGTCCEGQGSRLFGGLPEYIYSTSWTGERTAAGSGTAESVRRTAAVASAGGSTVTVWVNLFAPSSIAVDVGGQAVNVTTTTGFPYTGEKDAKLAQKLGQRPSFVAGSPQEPMGQLAHFGPTQHRSRYRPGGAHHHPHGWRRRPPAWRARNPDSRAFLGDRSFRRVAVDNTSGVDGLCSPGILRRTDYCCMEVR
jgi:hypothetical protein